MNDANLTYFLYLFSSNRIDSANNPNYMDISRALINEIKARFETLTIGFKHKIIYSIGKLPFNDPFISEHVHSDLVKMSHQKLDSLSIEPYLSYLLYAMSKELVPSEAWPSLLSHYWSLLSQPWPSAPPKAICQRLSQVFFNCLMADLIDGPRCLLYLALVAKHPLLKRELSSTKNIVHLLSLDVPDREAVAEFIKLHFNAAEIERYSKAAGPVLQSQRPKLAYMHYWLTYFISRAGFQFQSEFQVGYRHIDIFVPSLKLLVECDGLSHYIFEHGGKKTNAITRYRNRMLREWDAAGENSLVTIETGFQQDKNQTLDFITERIARLHGCV